MTPKQKPASSLTAQVVLLPGVLHLADHPNHVPSEPHKRLTGNIPLHQGRSHAEWICDTDVKYS